MRIKHSSEVNHITRGWLIPNSIPIFLTSNNTAECLIKTKVNLRSHRGAFRRATAAEMRHFVLYGDIANATGINSMWGRHSNSGPAAFLLQLAATGYTNSWLQWCPSRGRPCQLPIIGKCTSPFNSAATLRAFIAGINNNDSGHTEREIN